MGESAANGETYKIIVFFVTARIAGFIADLYKDIDRTTTVLEMHSRLSTGSNVVMFSSDVSARGMDYPDVSYVIQVGSTEKAQYIHRLGRTARAGKEGSGMLLICDFEQRSMKKELYELPIEYIDKSVLNLTNTYERLCLPALNNNIELKKSAEQAYQAWLGYYNGKVRVCGWNKDQLVEQANIYSTTIGLREIPGLQKKTIGKMGLKGVPGLKIAPFQP